MHKIRLTAKEKTAQLIEHLTEKLYHHTQDIVNTILGKWSVEYSISGLKNSWKSETL